MPSLLSFLGVLINGACSSLRMHLIAKGAGTGHGHLLWTALPIAAACMEMLEFNEVAVLSWKSLRSAETWHLTSTGSNKTRLNPYLRLDLVKFL